MNVFFVHGMGRSPLSAWPMLLQLRRAGLRTQTFHYSTALADFDAIVARLGRRLAALAGEEDEYLLIGHSLGGMMLRAALAGLPDSARKPRRLFLLGSPIAASRLAVRLQGSTLFGVLTGDCGRMLATPARMAALPATPPDVPATAIVGIRGLAGGPFRGESNDGIVARAEVVAPWLDEIIEIPVVHTLLPASGRVAEIVLERVLNRSE